MRELFAQCPTGCARPEVNGSDDTFAGAPEPTPWEERQREFFEFAGPLFSVTVSPASSVVRVGEQKELRALPRDRSRRRVEQDLEFTWQVTEGSGTLVGNHNQALMFVAPEEPGLTRVKVTVRQHDVICEGEGLITITHELLPQLGTATVSTQGLPGYTFERAPGELWRSRFDAKHNLIIINNGHRDFVYASRSKSLKLRYLVRLYRQGARLTQLRRPANGAAPRTHGRALVAHRGTSVNVSTIWRGIVTLDQE